MPPGVNPIAVNKYIVSYIISYNWTLIKAMLVERLAIKWQSGSQHDRSVFVWTVLSNSRAWPFLATSLPIHSLSTSYNSTYSRHALEKQVIKQPKPKTEKSPPFFYRLMTTIHCTIISSHCSLSVRDAPKIRLVLAVNCTAVFKSSPYTPHAITHKFRKRIFSYK